MMTLVRTEPYRVWKYTNRSGHETFYREVWDRAGKEFVLRPER